MAGKVRAHRAPQLDFAITEDHIQTAIPADSSHCMIADALQAAMPNATYISVDLATIRFTDRLAGRRYIYLTPGVAQEALIAFDQGEPVEPFTIKARAAQMIYTGSAQKARKIQAEDTAEGDPKPKRQRAKLTRDAKGLSQQSPGIKDGGAAPPVGPLATGTGTNNPPNRRGRRRQFGLRALIR
jgi:hypothetical protein